MIYTAHFFALILPRKVQYASLNHLQHKDGCYIVNDAAAFRLDTMATHHLHKTMLIYSANIILLFQPQILLQRCVQE